MNYETRSRLCPTIQFYKQMNGKSFSWYLELGLGSLFETEIVWQTGVSFSRYRHSISCRVCPVSKMADLSAQRSNP